MNYRNDTSTEWNIPAHVGPMLFNIMINSSFFNYSTHQSSERHRHATYELHFITEGAGILATDDNEYEIVPDCFYVIRAGLYHWQKGEASIPIHRYSLKFDYELSNTPGEEHADDEIKNFIHIMANTPFFFSRNFGCIKPLIGEIKAELKLKPLGYYTKVNYLFSLLFISIMREISMEANYKFILKPPETHLGNRLSIIENFFDFNFDYKPTSKELCDLIHLSSSQLNRFLKKKYHMTFKQKHIERQIEYAKDMLANTNLPIRVIAEKMGYTSEGNFTAFFKRVMGISPKVFRKQCRLSTPVPSDDPQDGSESGQ